MMNPRKSASSILILTSNKATDDLQISVQVCDMKTKQQLASELRVSILYKLHVHCASCMFSLLIHILSENRTKTIYQILKMKNVIVL